MADEVKSTLEVMQQVFEPKYLGLPVPEGRVHKGQFESLQERLRKRLIDWSEQFVSTGNKEILIKAVAQAIPTYVMSVFRLPASVCDDLMRMMRQYGWGVENGKRKMAWLSWEKMILPKDMGGMGFRDMRSFNQALLAKQAWRLLDSPDSLCARLLRAKYYPNGNLLDTVFPSSSSAVWNGSMHGLDLLKKGLIWRVGDGSLIKTWRDPWIPRKHDFKPITPKRNCRHNWVADFLDESGAWNMQMLRQYFWDMDIREIVKIRTSSRRGQDFLAWFPEKSGLFTVKSAYHLAREYQLSNSMSASSSNPSGHKSI